MRILASRSPGEVRTALLDGDRLLEAWVERAGVADGVGDLHRARVSALAPAMAGAFVGMGVDPDGFGQPWWPQQAVTVFDNFLPDCPSWVSPKWACW